MVHHGFIILGDILIIYILYIYNFIYIRIVHEPEKFGYIGIIPLTMTPVNPVAVRFNDFPRNMVGKQNAH